MKIRRVRDLGPQFVSNSHRMVGQDGAFSIPLNGVTLWFFGDTLIGRRVPGESLWYPGGQWIGPGDMSGKATFEKMLNNTGLVLPRQTGENGLCNYRYICEANEELKTLIPLLPNEDPDWIRVWCLHGIALADKIYLYYIKIKMLEQGPLPANFSVIGSGVAAGTKKDWSFRRLFYEDRDIFWPLGQPHFATAVLPEQKEGWLYLYGVKKNKRGIQNCYLARVQKEDIGSLADYEYLSSKKPAWSTDVHKAVPLFSGMPNEMSVSFNHYLDCYLSVHSYNLSGRIVGRTAPQPWGPWTEPVTIWNVKVKNKRPIPYKRLIYAGKEHPSLSDRNGRIIYITYVEFEEYYPHLLEAELE